MKPHIRTLIGNNHPADREPKRVEEMLAKLQQAARDDRDALAR